VKVLKYDPATERVSLGYKQLTEDPWFAVGERYPVGARVGGRVVSLTDYGAFIELEPGVEGLIHVSEMSWSKRVKHPSEVLKKGDRVEAVVLNIDAENQRLSLGLKQLATDIWDEFFSQRHVGDVVEGKVVRLTNFGAFVELAEGIEGLIHVSEFDDQQGSDKIDLQVDQAYPMKIIKLSPGERKIGLSIRALKADQDRADWEAYAQQAGSGVATIADHLKNQ
jgi:small subunit ribosomal protein S1